MGVPVGAQDDGSGVRPVAGELDKRTKQTQTAPGQSGGLSDSAVRVLLTYAFSLIPEETPGPDGKPLKVDKSDPNKFLIPTDDARRVIRAATRSAYAEICDLIDLGQANYQTLIKGEEARNTWSREQLLMITALHIFSVSYFTGNITVATEEAPAQGAGDAAQSADESAEPSEVAKPERPTCPPEQKEKVTNAINAYVQSAQATAPKGAE